MRQPLHSVAMRVGVPRTRIERLANEQTAVIADTALRLARYFGTSPSFWIGIQAQHDLERAQDELRRRAQQDRAGARSQASGLTGDSRLFRSLLVDPAEV